MWTQIAEYQRYTPRALRTAAAVEPSPKRMLKKPRGAKPRCLT